VSAAVADAIVVGAEAYVDLAAGEKRAGRSGHEHTWFVLTQAYRPEMRKQYYDPTKFGTYLEQLGITYPTVRTPLQ
jgi:hypothetical protein